MPLMRLQIIPLYLGSIFEICAYPAVIIFCHGIHCQVIYYENVHAHTIFSMAWSGVEWNWLFNVTINDISVIYVTAHRCAGGLKHGSKAILHMYYCTGTYFNATKFLRKKVKIESKYL